MTYIAGVNYRCDKQDIGGFVGTAVPERGNPHDRNAVAIYRHNDKKHIGYLPRDKAKEYRDLFGTKITPCAGYITYGNKAPLRSGVKILDPTDENRAETEMMAYIRWMVNTFGPDYCPPEVDLAE